MREASAFDMLSTCFHAINMPGMIRIRNVPEPLHRRLKARAAWAGLSLSDYLLNEIRHAAERPTPEEMRQRLARLPRADLDVPPAEVVRRERDGH